MFSWSLTFSFLTFANHIKSDIAFDILEHCPIRAGGVPSLPLSTICLSGACRYGGGKTYNLRSRQYDREALNPSVGKYPRPIHERISKDQVP